MRKVILLFLAIMLCVASPSFASVGVKVDGVNQGVATDLSFTGAGSSLTNDGSNWTFGLLLAGIANGGAVSMATTDTSVSPSYSFVRKAISALAAGNQTGTLADGTPGKIIRIQITAVGASGTWKLTPTTCAGFDSITFDAVDDAVTLLFVNTTTGWVIVSSNALTINHTTGK